VGQSEDLAEKGFARKVRMAGHQDLKDKIDSSPISFEEPFIQE